MRILVESTYFDMSGKLEVSERFLLLVWCVLGIRLLWARLDRVDSGHPPTRKTFHFPPDYFDQKMFNRVGLSFTTAPNTRLGVLEIHYQELFVLVTTNHWWRGTEPTHEK